MKTQTKEGAEKRMAQMEKQIGGVFVVPLKGNLFCYAQYLPDHTFAFYDYLAEEHPDTALITAQPVLFRTAMMSLIVFSQRAYKWKKLGHASVPANLEAPAVFCRRTAKGRDSSTQELLYDYYKCVGDELSPIIQAECSQLELNAVWHPLHIIDRLRKHYQLTEQ